jgi:hypothetical protein
MADWRQIQARIRKAKTGTDAPAQLAELYERTRDAMVAFELAQWQEKAGDNAEAVRWYTTAAQRFRRAQWRTRAEEALTRLGAPIPVPTAESTEEAKPAESPQPEEAAPALSFESQQEATSDVSTSLAEEPAGPSAPQAPAGEQPAAKRRRRGRRGGRGRRGRGAAPRIAEAPARASFAPAQSVPFAPEPRQPAPVQPRYEPAPSLAAPERSYEPAATPSWQGRTRTGEPALASRIAQLESQLRRLLVCPQVPLEDADQAPAGPGVLLLSDSDQVNHYYIEACQTLRIAIANLLRGSRGSRDAGLLKERLAENLGIGESRVSKYLKDHCAVRWLQLDEGAPELAHFAIAVLRPVVNE